MKKILSFFKKNVSKQVAFSLIGFFFATLTFLVPNYFLYSSDKEHLLYKEKLSKVDTILEKSTSLNTSVKKEYNYQLVTTNILKNIVDRITFNENIYSKYENNSLGSDSINLYIDSLTNRNYNLIFDMGKINAYKYSNDKNYSEGQSIFSNTLKSELKANKNILSFLNNKIIRNDSIQESVNDYYSNIQTLITYAESKPVEKKEIDIFDKNEYLGELNKIKSDYHFRRISFMFLSIFSFLIFVILIILSFKAGYTKK